MLNIKSRVVIIISLAVLFLYLPPATLLTDLPRSLSLVLMLAPWRWDWGKLLWIFVHAFVLLILLAGAGGRMLKLLKIRNISAWESLIPSVAIGLGLVGFSILGLGLDGLIQRKMLLSLYLLLSINAFQHFFVQGHPLTDETMALIARRRGQGIPGSGPVMEKLGRWEVIALFVATLWTVLFLFPDLLAPEGFWDALVYHLASPKRWMEAHKMVTIVPFFSNFPVLMPMNYMLALAIRGEGLARGLNVSLGILTALAVWMFARQWLDRNSSIRAAFLVGTSPLLLLLSVHAGADTGSVLMGVLAVYMFSRAYPEWPGGGVQRSFLFLSGIFAGLAYSAKPHGLAVLVVLVLLQLRYTRRLPVFLAPTLVLCFPWMVRAFIQTGDPLFPLLGMFNNSSFWTKFSREAYGGELLAIWRQFSWSDLNNWGMHSDLVSRYKLGLTGPAALLAVVIAMLSRPRRGMPALILVFSGLLGMIWVFTVPAWRFYGVGLALLPVLIFLVPGISRALFWGVLAIQAIWWPIVVAEVDRPWAAAQGKEDRDTYYSNLHVNPSLDAFSFIEKKLQPGARNRTLATGEVRGFLAPAWTIAASYFEEAPFLKMAVESGSSSRLAIRLKQQGVRYLLVNVPEMLRLSMDQKLCWNRPFPADILVDFFRKKTDIIYARKAAWVYELSAHPAGAVIPECFGFIRDQSTLSSVTASGMVSMALARGERTKALVYGFSAVSALPHSGMAWAMLGDALYSNGRFNEATNSYRRALESGWRTSSVYRNLSMCFVLTNHPVGAQPGMAYAIKLDPYATQLRQEFALVHQEIIKPLRRIMGDH